jgi:hypothetical protein
MRVWTCLLKIAAGLSAAAFFPLSETPAVFGMGDEKMNLYTCAHVVLKGLLLFSVGG